MSTNTNFPALLEKHGREIARALPRHLSPERMMRVALTAFRLNPRLAQCDPLSVYAAVIQASQLGLEIGGPAAEAHLVPFKDECQLIPGYQGLMKLARNTGEIADLYAYEVRERDQFSVSFGLRRTLTHSPLMNASGFLASNDERGPVTGFYAVAVFTNGTTAFTVMAREDMETVKAGSSGFRAKGARSPWSTHPVEMGCKTVIRRLCKFLPRSPELAAALALDSRAEQGLEQRLTVESAVIGDYAETEYAEAEYEASPAMLPASSTVDREADEVAKRIDAAGTLKDLIALRQEVVDWRGPGRDRLKTEWKAKRAFLQAHLQSAPAPATPVADDEIVGDDYISGPSIPDGSDQQ